MDVSSIGPGNLDPFTPSPGPSPESPNSDPVSESSVAPLPEGSGTIVDTSV